ncbi:MAG TPA: MBOAT family O-acyltransferase [Puia sp.]|nr:MBOAT family O-acyltransferase [Puia sp.]
MPFLSLPFLLFLPAFFLLYWYVLDSSLPWQNLLVLAGSYLFYAWWDWRFLFLLTGSSLLNYWLGLGLERAARRGARRALVAAGLVQGLGCLLYFKFFNALLPLGISFYTFKTLSYLLDIERGKIRAEKDWVVFFSYVAFFPCLIAGPIDRPGVLIPQLKMRRFWDERQGTDGMRRILWGLFKKVVIADNCVRLTDGIFDHYKAAPASALLFAAFMYTIQLYADFSGYSDMAIGIGSLLGFRVSPNFRHPFFSRNIAEYWRRWHITLTSWLTDYVFTPLNIYFRDYGKAGLILAILINFTAIGIWHGPKWTFAAFGFLHGCYYIPLVLRGRLSRQRGRRGQAGKAGVAGVASVAGTFLLVMLTNIIFRAPSLRDAFGYFRRMLSRSLLTAFPVTEKLQLEVTLAGIMFLFAAEWRQRDKDHPLQIDFIRPFPVRALVYYIFLGLILGFGPARFSEFIYIRF